MDQDPRCLGELVRSTDEGAILEEAVIGEIVRARGWSLNEDGDTTR